MSAEPARPRPRRRRRAADADPSALARLWSRLRRLVGRGPVETDPAPPSDAEAEEAGRAGPKTAETKTAETKTAETKTADTKTADDRAAAPKTAGSDTAAPETRPAETSPQSARPAAPPADEAAIEETEDAMPKQSRDARKLAARAPVERRKPAPAKPRRAKDAAPTGPAASARQATAAGAGRRGAGAPKRAAGGKRAAAAQRTLERREVTVEGVRIHAVDSAAETGRPDGRAIVLIHGAGLDHRDWTFGFLHRLDRSWRVLAFDRPGFGGSERPSGMASALPATQARLLHAAARELGVDHAVIVGHSWGGAVAMGWGLEAPETVAGIVSLAGALTPWSLAVTMDNARRLQAAARQALGSGGLRAAAVSALADSFDPDDIPAGYIDHVRTDLGGPHGAAAALAADISTINGALSLMTPRYAGFTKPVSLVYGAADRILDGAAQVSAAQRLLPNTTLELLPLTGHMVHHTHPETCVRAIHALTEGAA